MCSSSVEQTRKGYLVWERRRGGRKRVGGGKRVCACREGWERERRMRRSVLGPIQFNRLAQLRDHRREGRPRGQLARRLAGRALDAPARPEGAREDLRVLQPLVAQRLVVRTLVRVGRRRVRAECHLGVRVHARDVLVLELDRLVRHHPRLRVARCRHRLLRLLAIQPREVVCEAERRRHVLKLAKALRLGLVALVEVDVPVLRRLPVVEDLLEAAAAHLARLHRVRQPAEGHKVSDAERLRDDIRLVVGVGRQDDRKIGQRVVRQRLRLGAFQAHGGGALVEEALHLKGRISVTVGLALTSYRQARARRL